jgi:hypothetical protein
MVKKKKFDKELEKLLFINLAVLILILSFFNMVNNRQKNVQVLGIKTDNGYWEEIVKKHPTYRDAWVELGRTDKVKEIDPNWKSDRSE